MVDVPLVPVQTCVVDGWCVWMFGVFGCLANHMAQNAIHVHSVGEVVHGKHDNGRLCVGVELPVCVHVLHRKHALSLSKTHTHQRGCLHALWSQACHNVLFQRRLQSFLLFLALFLGASSGCQGVLCPELF